MYIPYDFFEEYSTHNLFANNIQNNYDKNEANSTIKNKEVYMIKKYLVKDIFS